MSWAREKQREGKLVEKTLNMAPIKRRPGPGLLDRGSHTPKGRTNLSYRAKLEDVGIEISMSHKGGCYDNGVVGSFNGTLKCAIILHKEPFLPVQILSQVAPASLLVDRRFLKLPLLLIPRTILPFF